MKFTNAFMARQALVASLYAVLTWIVPVMSYGPLQFRFSEVMTLLAFFNPGYVVGLTVGCALSNIFSSLGLIDVVVGTFATFLAVTAMSKIKNIWLASLMPAIGCIIIGLEIYVLSDTPINFFLVTAQIMLSEIIIVTFIGVPLFKYLEKNQIFKRLVLDYRD